MDARRTIGRLAGHGAMERRVVRDYGRDSLLVWANLLLGPLLGMLGMRVGLQSEERIAARIQSDATAMRKKGYLVASVQRFSLPVMGAAGTSASWYRVTYELAVQPGDVTGQDPGA